jgi:hypothetical protein
MPTKNIAKKPFGKPLHIRQMQAWGRPLFLVA